MILAELYKTIYINIVLLMVIWAISNKKSIPDYRRNKFMGFMVLFLIIFIGFRPISDVFTDMPGYANSYNMNFIRNQHGEFTWEYCMNLFHSLNLSVDYWFLFIAAGYIGFMWSACKRIFDEYAWFAMIFFLSSFTFFNYGTNVLRNGLALSIVLYGISNLIKPKFNKMWANYLFVVAIYALAFGIHKSSLLPAFCSLVAFNLKKPRIPIIIWGICLLVSYFVSDYTEIIFTELGFDDRLESYLSNVPDEDRFSNVGFRFDFLAYSIAPLLLAYHVSKKEILKESYIHIINTYLLANSFWLLCIKANFFDRFAQLSWFIYPLLLVYPLFETEILSEEKYRNRVLAFFFMFAYIKWLL